MNLSDYPDINFVDADKETILTEIISLYTTTTGRTLAQGDPIRLFLYAIATLIIQLINKINYTGKQNLLRYAVEEKLDHIGALVDVDRLAASAATTTIRITLSAARAVSTTIPAGTRITAGDKVFFATDSAVIILAGDTETTVSATCTVTGETGNGYLPGELQTIVDPVPFVASMINTTLSEGGSSQEDDDNFRESIHLAPEGFSSAGPDGAYQYFAKRTSALIVDVAVTTPEPGKVNIIPLLTGGNMPGEEILADVLESCNSRKVRPLTDNVSVLAPTVKNYDIQATYYIDVTNEIRAGTIQTEVTNAVADYVLWQKSKLGRDINPSELIKRVMVAGAKRIEIITPVFTAAAKTEVSIAQNISVTFGGFENE